MRLVQLRNQYVLSATVLSARNATHATSKFRTIASSLDILPAAWFFDMIASSYYSFGDGIDAAGDPTTTFIRGNATAIGDGFQAKALAVF
jgi:hypothetical protein